MLQSSNSRPTRKHQETDFVGECSWIWRESEVEAISCYNHYVLDRKYFSKLLLEFLISVFLHPTVAISRGEKCFRSLLCCTLHWILLRCLNSLSVSSGKVTRAWQGNSIQHFHLFSIHLVASIRRVPGALKLWTRNWFFGNFRHAFLEIAESSEESQTAPTNVHNLHYFSPSRENMQMKNRIFISKESKDPIRYTKSVVMERQ